MRSPDSPSCWFRKKVELALELCCQYTAEHIAVHDPDRTKEANLDAGGTSISVITVFIQTWGSSIINSWEIRVQILGHSAPGRNKLRYAQYTQEKSSWP